MTKLALFDLDGVIFNDDHRVDFALNRQWMDYFRPDRVAADPIYDEGRHTVEQMEMLGWKVGYITGRRDTLREVSENALDEAGFPVGRLVMRRIDQKQRLAEFKAEYVGRILETGRFQRVVVFDDDREVVREIQDRFGESYATLCTWHVKQESLIKKAIA